MRTFLAHMMLCVQTLNADAYFSLEGTQREYVCKVLHLFVHN